MGNIAPRDVTDYDRQAVTPSTARTAPSAKDPGPVAAPAAAPPAAPAAEPSAAAVTEAVRHINKTMQAMSQQIEFSIDDDSKRVVVKVIDQQTKEVIRQIPSVEALEIAKALDRVQGLLIRQKA
jgi:flagellar protein FlaG